jgi:hypothetical protein
MIIIIAYNYNNIENNNKGNIVAKYARHKTFCQRYGHYRYAYRRYALGNIRTISEYFIISTVLELANTNLNYMCQLVVMLVIVCVTKWSE